MGIVREDIILTNAMDEALAERGQFDAEKVRSVTVNSVVDTGAITLVINEEVREKLGLRIIEQRYAKLADGNRTLCNLTEPIHIQWKNRNCRITAYVVPTANNVLLGAIPLEDMDLIVDPVKQQLIGRHGEEIVSYLL